LPSLASLTITTGRAIYAGVTRPAMPKFIGD